MAEITRRGLTSDTIYYLLSNRRRRFVIHALKRADQSIKIPKLATFVAAWELGVKPKEVPRAKRRSVYTTLRRTHLPKLEKHDVVTVDEERNVVKPTSKFEKIEVYTQVIRDRGLPWSYYYIGVCLVSTIGIFAVRFDISGFAMLSHIQISVLISGVFAILSFIHHLYTRRNRLGSEGRPPEVQYSD